MSHKSRTNQHYHYGIRKRKWVIKGICNPSYSTIELYNHSGLFTNHYLFYVPTTSSFTPATGAFQPDFAEPVVNISVAVGRDATFTCHVRHLGGYRVSQLNANECTLRPMIHSLGDFITT